MDSRERERWEQKANLSRHVSFERPYEAATRGYNGHTWEEGHQDKKHQLSLVGLLKEIHPGIDGAEGASAFSRTLPSYKPP